MYLFFRLLVLTACFWRNKDAYNNIVFIYCLGSVIFAQKYEQIVVSPQIKCLFTLNYHLHTMISKVLKLIQGALNSANRLGMEFFGPPGV